MKISYAYNKRARYDYEILETLEAGISLLGSEVKSIRQGHCSLKGAFVVLKNKRPYLLNATIPPYQAKNTPKDYNPSRSRELLLNKNEINRLIGQSKEKGLTLVPIKVYNKRNKIKLQIGIGRGKKKFDKREALKKKNTKREIERALRSKNN